MDTIDQSPSLIDTLTPSDWGKFLDHILRKARMKQGVFADRCNVSAAFLSLVIKGKKKITTAIMRELDKLTESVYGNKHNVLTQAKNYLDSTTWLGLDGLHRKAIQNSSSKSQIAFFDEFKTNEIALQLFDSIGIRPPTGFDLNAGWCLAISMIPRNIMNENIDNARIYYRVSASDARRLSDVSNVQYRRGEGNDRDRD